MLKEIPLNELKVGMYVESYGAGTFADPLCSVRAFVFDTERIKALKAEGVEKVVVDTEKLLPASPASEPTPAASRQSLTVAPASTLLYTKCLSYVSDVMQRVRQGYGVDTSHSGETVDALIEGVKGDTGGMTLLAKLHRHDDYTLRHCLNVSLLSLIFGRHLGLGEDELHRLGVAGLYHDVGKFRISLNVLNKPGRLSEREFEIMKRHCDLGYELLKGQAGMTQDILLGVLNHHERYDGKGYHHMTADKADPFSRIITIVDIFDALTSDRVYHKAKTPNEALKAMFAWRNENFHPGLLERFVQCFGVYPPSSFVRLSDRSYALVVDANAAAPARPTVKVIYTPKLKPCLPKIVTLSDLPKEGPGSLNIEECLDPRPLGIALERFY
ncbi:HD-GYP domain-containing protein [Fundidesulfovibrio butyratiphilus]